jgi:hypothetical protein
MIALRRADVADLNRPARQTMRDHGRLRGDDVRVGERDYAQGDRVVLAGNDRRHEVVNGDRGHVLHAEPNEVEVQLDRGPIVRLPAHYAVTALAERAAGLLATEHVNSSHSNTAGPTGCRPLLSSKPSSTSWNVIWNARNSSAMGVPMASARR